MIQKPPIRSRLGAVRRECRYLFKNGNTTGDELEASLRASRQGVIRRVTALDKGMAIACAPCLAANPLAISLNHYFIPYTRPAAPVRYEKRGSRQ